MQAGTGTEIALALAACALLVALVAFTQVRAGQQDLACMACVLAGLEVGTALLRASDDVPSGRLERAMDGWDHAVRRLTRGRRRRLVQLVGPQVVDLWERAFAFTQQRRVADPSRWSALADLYVDAYDRRQPGDAPPMTSERSRTPDEEPSPEPEAVLPVVPVDDPPPVPDPVEAPLPAPEPVDPWLAALRAGLAGEGPSPRPLPVRVPETTAPVRPAPPVGPAPRVVQHVVIDLVDVEVEHAPATGLSG